MLNLSIPVPSAILSNGLTIYQRSGIEKDGNNQDLPTTQGFYSLKLKEQRYLTIYFVINDLDYTVKGKYTQANNHVVYTT